MAMHTKTVGSPSFTEDEQALIITDLMALKMVQISELLASVGLKRSGAWEVLRARIEEALEDGSLTLPQVVQYLDDVIPWGKQHVYLYKGPQSSIANWRNMTSTPYSVGTFAIQFRPARPSATAQNARPTG